MLRFVLAVAAVSLVTVSGNWPERVRALAADTPVPRGSRILYSGDWTGQSEVFAVDPSGRAPLGEVTFGREPVPAHGCDSVACGFVAPVPSPDGRWVLYRGIGGEYWPGLVHPGSRLWLARADGSSPRLVSPAAGVQVSWMADSSRFAYTADDGLHVVQMRGLRDQTVRGGSVCGRCGVAWSPDGVTLAFFDTFGRLVLTRRGRERSVFSIDDPSGLQLAWSPDGEWITIGQSAIDRFNVSPAVLLVAPDGSGVIRLDGASGPVWSPDGRLLAFESPHGITIWSPATRLSRVLSREPGFDLAWSPDGRSLAYVEGSIGGSSGSTGFAGFEASGDIRTVSLTGRVRRVVAAARPYGGQITSLAWPRTPAKGGYRRPLVPDGVFAGGPVALVAGDGGRAALVACHHVYVWDLPQTRLVRADPNQGALNTYPDGMCLSQDKREQIYALALAGDRVAWAEKEAGLGFRWLVRSTTLTTSPQTFDLKIPNPTEGCLACQYNKVVGSGSLLAFNDFPSAGEPTTIYRADQGGCPCPAIHTDPGPLYLDDTDNGRLLAHGKNAIVLLDSTGTQLLSIPVPAPAQGSDTPRLSARLTDNEIAVLLDNQLIDYDASSGTLLHAWPLPGASFFQLQDATHGLAAYVQGDNVHLIRMSDGKNATVATGGPAGFTDAGLAYADGARIHLIPYDKLPLH